MRLAGRGVLRVTAVAGGVIAAVLLLPYVLTPAFDYPPSAAFSGPRWYNPYAGMQGSWHQVALHDHGRSCCFRSIERRSDEEVSGYYRRLGYDVPLIADHQRFAFVPGPRVYEHGANLLKTHQLVIGARHIEWLDFPLFQSTDDKQYMLARLHDGAELVGIAHPEIRNGYSFADLRRLTGYDFMEVAYQDASYEPWWDAALSAGRLSWATGSDDAHGTGRPAKMGLAWTMLRAPSTQPAALVGALRAGWSYAASGHRGVQDVQLRDVTIRGDTLVVTTDPGALSFTFIGQGGRVRAVVRASASARYVLRPADSYIRTVVRTPRTVLLLNPVVRTSDGRRPVLGQATPALATIWAWRSAVLAGLVALAWALARRSRPAGAAPAPARSGRLRTRRRRRVPA